MARSTYYYHIAHIEQSDKYSILRARIGTIFEWHQKRYGYRRVYLQLRNEGYVVNHKTVQKLMLEMRLKSKVRKVRYKSYKGEIGRIAPNILNRNFSADRPNEKWATDVTEFKIKESKSYLSPILDMYNGEIVSYTISDRPDLKMVTDMVNKAMDKIKGCTELILHSDQGWHYQHANYRKLLQKKGLVQSMSRKGNCLDNAVMENFFGIVKSELLYLQKFDSIQQFKIELGKYIEYYNNDRIKIRLNGKSPVKYRTLSS